MFPEPWRAILSYLLSNPEEIKSLLVPLSAQLSLGVTSVQKDTKSEMSGSCEALKKWVLLK